MTTTEPDWPKPPTHGWGRALFAAAHDLEPHQVDQADIDQSEFGQVLSEMTLFDRAYLAVGLGLPTSEPNGDPVYDETIADELHRIRTERRAGRTPGMTVDGDMLRDVLLDVLPDILSIEACRDIADRALDAAVAAGFTVLQGPDLTPRPGKGEA